MSEDKNTATNNVIEIEKRKVDDLKIKDTKAVRRERREILDLIQQLKGIHVNNKSTITVLDFLMDCIEQRNK